MPNHPAPKTVNEIVEILRTGFDEEDADLSKLTQKELDDELLNRGIDVRPALDRVRHLLGELRSDSPVKPLSPVEALYQKCRAIPSSLCDDILELVQSIRPEKASQALTYAATIDLHDNASVEQFKQNLEELSDSPTKAEDRD